MKRLAAIALALGASALSATPAFAGERYFSINVGAAFPPDQDLEGAFLDDLDIETPFQGEARFDPSFYGSVAWGYLFAPAGASGFALDVEGFYHAISPENFTFGGIDLDPNVDDAEEFFAGNASAFGGFVNASFKLQGNNSPFSARAGGGVGYARIAYDIENAFDEGDGGLAYQLFAGVGYDVSQSVTLNLTGRYFGLADTEIRDDRFDVDAQFDSLIATVGLTWAY